MTKDVNRSAYTKRMMEIVANIKKQKKEIDKVLSCYSGASCSKHCKPNKVVIRALF